MNRLLSYPIQELKAWQKRSPQLAITTYVVLSIHLFLIAFFLTERELHPKKKEAITVHTVSLQPKKQAPVPVATVAPVAPVAPAVVAAPIETPEITPAPKVSEPPPPPKEKEKPKPKKEQQPPKKEPPPKPKEDKKSPAPKPKSETKPPKPTKPKSEVKPEKPKEKPKKETPPPAKPKKETPPKKEESAAPRETAKKETPKKESKETATSKESTPQKKPSETTQKQKERSAEQEKLLAEALNSLDQASSTKSSAAATSSKAAVAPLLAPPGTLGGESLEAAQREYKDELARYLKLLLKLPEYGPVKIELLVRREGTVAHVKILSSESTLNRQYVESNLPKHRLPPFGQSFPGDKEHTFVLTLTNQ